MNYLGFNGVRIFETELVTTQIAVKRSKNPRQQKKFIKIFGYKYVPGVIQTPLGMFVHPEIVAKLRTHPDFVSVLEE